MFVYVSMVVFPRGITATWVKEMGIATWPLQQKPITDSNRLPFDTVMTDIDLMHQIFTFQWKSQKGRYKHSKKQINEGSVTDSISNNTLTANRYAVLFKSLRHRQSFIREENTFSGLFIHIANLMIWKPLAMVSWPYE